jgi:tetratricopeptide (TPR) repeat protein
MQIPTTDAKTLATSGFSALRKGDARTARALLDQVAMAGQADEATWYGLAVACAQLNEHEAASSAVDKMLLLQPRNLRGLILKADLLARAGDVRNASSFYQLAVLTAPPAHELPAESRTDLARAVAMCKQYAEEFERSLRDRLIPEGLLERGSADRFRQSFEIMLGKKRIHFQQPRIYYFPELPQIQFYDRNDFPAFDKAEAATADIRAEMMEVLKDTSAFKPYVENDPKRPPGDQTGMKENPDWSAFYLWRDGEIVPENAARCPKTMAALADFPLVHIQNRSPSVLFSLLRPRSRIPPHTGIVNTRLICHLPLLVPPDCGLRVGNDARAPVEGKAWLFDDTIEHEAWNDSDLPRVILLFETWRPELTAKERGLVTAMFGAIDAYSGKKPDWEI